MSDTELRFYKLELQRKKEKNYGAFTCAAVILSAFKLVEIMDGSDSSITLLLFVIIGSIICNKIYYKKIDERIDKEIKEIK
jgi:hypothetical protein